MTTTTSQILTEDQVSDFHRDGFLLLKGAIDERLVTRMREVAWEGIAREIEPIEYEADVHYPGSPESRSAAGGRTIRRLRNAFSRHPVFSEWLQSPVVYGSLSPLLGEQVIMPMAHHNCIMTKHPRHSSETGWHQDIRYWSYSRADLINVWVALTEETPENGSLRLIPGTHRMDFTDQQFDDARFLRTDADLNQDLLASAVQVELAPGDALLFHARTFHAADQNTSDDLKLSAVFTFRGVDNPPIAGSRSAALPEIIVPVPTQHDS